MNTTRYIHRLATALAAGTVAAAMWTVATVAAQMPRNQLVGGLEHPQLPICLATAALIVAVSFAFRFPIHARLKTKVYTNSVPLFLLAALLPPPAAAIAAGLGQGMGELMARNRTRTQWQYTICQSARWTLIALAGSLVAHVQFAPGVSYVVPLVLAAATMLVGDLLTAPLVLAPMTRENPLHIISSITREAGLPEGAQYLIGILGAVVARDDLGLLFLLALPTVLVYHAFKRAKDMQLSTLHLLERMADTVDLRDPYTGGHSRRVTAYCLAMLKHLGVGGPEMDLVVTAARVHDIGKLAVPDYVLNKTGKLTEDEWAIMATHPDQGAELLTRYPDFARGVQVVRHHHERWDGDGYPHRLKGLDIPFGARVIAVADAFDAMTSDRPYRDGMTPQEAMRVLRSGRGRQWDGRIVDAFVRAVEDDRLFETISQSVGGAGGVGALSRAA
jgi:hypothetical protein